jgi:hypothetical protein
MLKRKLEGFGEKKVKQIFFKAFISKKTQILNILNFFCLCLLNYIKL